MARQLEIYSNVEGHGIVRFSWKKRFTSTEIHREISTIYEPHAMSRPAIVKWCQQFEDGCTDLSISETEVTVQIWRLTIFTYFGKLKEHLDGRQFSNSCSKLVPGPWNDILSSRLPNISGMSAATGRLCRKIVCCLCVTLYCRTFLNKVFLTYIIRV